MKFFAMRFSLAIAFIVAAVCRFGLVGQELPVDSLSGNENVGRFYGGCIKIIEAEKMEDGAARNSAYAEAMSLLNPRASYGKRGLVTSRMKLEFVDDSGLVSGGIKDFAFDYSYARSRYKSIDFVPKGVSRGGIGGCRVHDMVLAPGGKVVCREMLHGNCLLLAIVQPGGSVSLKVLDGDRELCGKAYEGGLVQYLHWQTGDSHPVDYVIENNGDMETTVSLIGN